MTITILVAEVVVPGMQAMEAGHMYLVDDKLGETLIKRGQAVEAFPKASGEKPERLKADKKSHKNEK